MPITTERLNDLLIEHEQCLILMREVKEAIIDTMRASEYDPSEDKGTTFFAIKSLLASFDRAPDHFARIERKHYKSTIKRTLNTRERMRMLRRRNGIPERQEPSNDIAEVAANMRADREYNRLNAVPYGADGKPMIDPDAQRPHAQNEPAEAAPALSEKKKSYVFDPDKPMSNAEFLAMRGPPEPVKTAEQLAAEAETMFDSVPSNEDVEDASNTVCDAIEPLMGQLEPKEPWKNPVEREICKKFGGQ
jgi:hypothetical protein